MSERSLPRSLVGALRPHQWVKNALLVVPTVLAHKFDRDTVAALVPAILAFCLCSSSAYILNDVLDMEADRAHPSKRNRPFASGALRPATGLLISFALLSGGLVLSWFTLPAGFTAVLAAYAALVAAYSVRLKHLLMIDVLCLAGFYAMRMFAGARAAGVPVSPWFIAFSIFLFQGLALIKRYTELKTCEASNRDRAPHRAYRTEDIQVVLTAGMCSGYLSVLVFCLYVTSSEVAASLYASPQLLWLIGPLLLYWFTRLWFIAQRGELDSDPVLFAIRDLPSWVVGVASALIVYAASEH